MSKKSIQGSCISCKSNFPIPIDELEDYMQCPKCGEDAGITAVCPHCGQNIGTNGRTIGCSYPCPSCKCEVIWNTVKATDGTSMVVSMTGRVEIQDIASALSIMQKQVEIMRESELCADILNISNNFVLEFVGNHMKTMPEDVGDVWNLQEVEFFAISLASNNAYMADINKFSPYAFLNDILIPILSEGETIDFDLLEKRYFQYFALFRKGSSSFLRVLMLSCLKPAVEFLVENSCKKYIFSYRDLVKVLHPWVREKHIECDLIIKAKLRSLKS